MVTMLSKLTSSYVEDSLFLFRHYKKLAERAMEQVTDVQLLTVLDPEMNSIAVIAKHMAGNMLSRWTGFLTTDGEKSNRDRDAGPHRDVRTYSVPSPAPPCRWTHGH